MFVVKYQSMSIWHAQMDWHRWNIHCSYFLVFVEITVDDLKGGRTSLWNFTLNVQKVTANYVWYQGHCDLPLTSTAIEKAVYMVNVALLCKISLQINIYIKCIKTDRHDIIEILLKEALNTINKTTPNRLDCI